jgi:hypothetical protein
VAIWIAILLLLPAFFPDSFDVYAASYPTAAALHSGSAAHGIVIAPDRGKHNTPLSLAAILAGSILLAATFSHAGTVDSSPRFFVSLFAGTSNPTRAPPFSLSFA